MLTPSVPAVQNGKVFLVLRGEVENRYDPDMVLYNRKVQKFTFPVKEVKNLLKSKPQYGSNQAGIERTSNNAVRYVRITDIDEYGLLRTELGATVQDIEGKYYLNHNDLLFARSGATVGKTFLFKKNQVEYPCIYAGYMIRFVLDESQILPDYFFAYTQLDVYKEWTKAIQRAAGQPNINAEEYKSLKIPIPPLEIQRQIVEKMETAYASKRAQEAEAAQLLAGIDGYLLEALGIRLPEVGEKKKTFFVGADKVSGGRLDPKLYLPSTRGLIDCLFNSKYQYKHLKDLITHSVSGDWGIENFEDGFEECLVIRATEFDNSYNLRLENNRVKYRFIAKTKLQKLDSQPNDLLIEKSGGSIDQPVGRIAILNEELVNAHKLAFSNFVHKIRLKADVNSDFAYYYLNTLHSIKVTDAMQSQTNGIRNLILNEYFNIPIPLPPLEIQNEIAAHIGAMRAQAQALEAEAKSVVEAAKKEVEAMILG